MSERQETTLFVASADGTAMEPLSRSELRRRLEARLLRWTQQVWCPEEGKWKPAREISLLAPPPAAPAPPVPVARPIPVAQSPTPRAVAPAPVPQPVAVKRPSVVQPAAQPRVSAVRVPSRIQVAVKSQPAPAPTLSPKAAPARSPTAVPVVRTPSVAKAPSVPRAAASVVRVPSLIATVPSAAPGVIAKAWYQRSPFFYGAGSLLIILALVGMNWLGAAVPARKAVADAGLAGKAVVTAHCGFYVQPGALVLNFERLPEDLSSEKFLDLFTALAVRNPTSTLFFAKYDSVALVKDGMIRCRLRGDAWKALADMKEEVAGRRAMMLINYLYDAAGKPVLDQKEDRMEYLQGQKEKALRDFLGVFIKLEGPSRPAAPSPSSPAP